MGDNKIIYQFLHELNKLFWNDTEIEFMHYTLFKNERKKHEMALIGIT